MHLGLLISDIIVVTLSWTISSYLVLGIGSYEDFFISSVFVIAILLAVKIFFFTKMGLYRVILRYASFHFARTIVKAVTMSSFFSYIIINFPSGQFPFGLLTFDWLLTLFLVGSSRFLPRYYSETAKVDSDKERKVLIYGAGDLGDALARALLSQKNIYHPIGFVDDDPRKQGKKVHNLPVLGNRHELSTMTQNFKVQEIIIACSNFPTDKLRELIKECRTQHIFCRIAPRISDMTSRDISLKNIDISDLLKRDPKDLDEKQIGRFLQYKKILITGAAGSIGSELVRQAFRFRPEKLILVDKSEFELYKLEEEINSTIKRKTVHCRLQYILQDVCYKNHVEKLIETERPDIIFHAAAYKHVPLLESNPFTGLLNNIRGTINIAEAADRYHVEKFVLISTDKAVRPTSIMGASKRICELYIQNLNLRAQKTEYVAVRFGNVLGSSGSVVPKFLEQIKEGGPVTVTHPNVTRYFMLTQEAVQLVMQAASIGHGGEIFFLNMGNPVKIKEMAENLIFLAGKEPYKDIDIHFTGLRPGEKLFEELLIDDTEKKTQYENITIGKMTFIEWNQLISKIEKILQVAKAHNRPETLTCIKDLVIEFQHADLPSQNNNQKIILLTAKRVAG